MCGACILEAKARKEGRPRVGGQPGLHIEQETISENKISRNKIHTPPKSLLTKICEYSLYS